MHVSVLFFRGHAAEVEVTKRNKYKERDAVRTLFEVPAEIDDLLAHGVDPGVEGGDGRGPLGPLGRSRHQHLVELVEGHGRHGGTDGLPRRQSVGAVSRGSRW